MRHDARAYVGLCPVEVEKTTLLEICELSGNPYSYKQSMSFCEPAVTGPSMVKTRTNGELTFDENGYKRRAACVVFRDHSEEEVSLLLVLQALQICLLAIY